MRELGDLRQVLPGVGVPHVGVVHIERQEAAFGVHHQIALAAGHGLGAVVAPIAPRSVARTVWLVITDGARAGAFGWTGGLGATWLVDPGRDLVVTVLTQSVVAAWPNG